MPRKKNRRKERQTARRKAEGKGRKERFIPRTPGPDNQSLGLAAIAAAMIGSINKLGKD